MEKFRKNIVFIVLLVAAATYGLWHAWDVRWACDDIFITLRYIDHWFAGNGIVYNTGEYVEGYTHFLWLLMAAAAGKLGFDMMNASLWLGLLSFAGVIFLSAWRAKKIGLFLPLAAIYFCFHHEMAIWATGGLETMFYGLLMLSVCYIRFQSDLKHAHKLLLSGLMCSLAILTRPDAALFLLWFGVQELLVLLFAKISFKELIIKLSLLAIFPWVILTPWLIWKINYYGDILPNTYYAKSGGLSYFSQGWDYLESYAHAYATVYVALFIGLLGAIIGFMKRNKNASNPTFEIPLYAQSFSVLIFIVIYSVLFIAKSGGDYMYARFIVPIVPLYMITAENGLVIITANWHRKISMAVTAVVVVAWVGFSFMEHHIRDEMFSVNGKWHAKIYDSHMHHKYSYPTGKYRKIGEELRPIFAGSKARVLNFGDCCLCYYAGFDYVLENFGLTDAYIAHKPIDKRVTMVGHEKTAEPEYWYKRDIQLCINGINFSDRNFTKFVFISTAGDSIKGDMLQYNKEVMETVKKNGGSQVQFIDPYIWFNDLISNKEQIGKDSLRNAYYNNMEYYFNSNRHLKSVKEQEEAIQDFIE